MSLGAMVTTVNSRTPLVIFKVKPVKMNTHTIKKETHDTLVHGQVQIIVAIALFVI